MNRDSRHILDVQKDAGKFVYLSMLWQCSASNYFVSYKDHTSMQVNVVEADKVTGKLNSQFKTNAIWEGINRLGESDDSILQLAKADGIVSKNF
ncbi:40S ribosomal protein S21-like [Canis lupus familiaris]|nr:40S ribosomal protein S21-like [Canis lupus dingo]XP_038361339.1 40S ribosomal protein S21-like [Canis lupus familiaris]XP_038391485.1 40S ribosomal protein S21-like [Canis lupus familiaris]XP_038520233.1 40S ribosomal protein S21-like [Canis lupus familiaris]